MVHRKRRRRLALVALLAFVLGTTAVAYAANITFNGAANAGAAGEGAGTISGYNVTNIKYTLDSAGFINELSKTMVGGLGEAVGINFVAAADRDILIAHLAACADDDYFERGLETAIGMGLRVRPVDISRFDCLELDFAADLERALQLMP